MPSLAAQSRHAAGSKAHIWMNFDECRVRMLKLVDIRVDAAMMA